MYVYIYIYYSKVYISCLYLWCGVGTGLGDSPGFVAFFVFMFCVLARVVWGGGSALMMVLLHKYNAYQGAIPCFFILVSFFPFFQFLSWGFFSLFACF